MVTAPWKRVIKARELTGPKGGTMIVMELECGCLVWKRRKVPARRLRCVTCWWKAQPNHPDHLPNKATSTSF